MKITHYSVEYRLLDTGYWRRWGTFKSPFQSRETIQHYKWFWFKRATLRTKITNQKEAEDEARVMALQAARELVHEGRTNVRVLKQEMFRMHGEQCTRWLPVWENGEFKDC